MDKFQAEAILCKDGINCSNEHISGTWSTVYDQSFKIELENGLRFLANFRYSIKDDISKTPEKDGADKFSNVMEKAVSAIGDLVKGFKDIKSSLVEQKKVVE